MPNKKKTKTINNIDIILTWVDNHDVYWLNQYNEHLKDADNKEISGRLRFENLEALQYTFRGIDKFLPWIRKVHFVTADQLPSWLNQTHPKLNIVSHKQIFPHKKDLPTFNACAIEMCFSNIPDLAEHFIYFNDDMFVLSPLKESRFFENGMPKDFLSLKILNHDGIFSHILHSDMQIINNELTNKTQFVFNKILKIFNFKYGFFINFRNFLLAPQRAFSLFQVYHHPQPLLKSALIEVENKHLKTVQKTRSSRFKSPTDINQYVFRYINLLKGNFIPFYPRDTAYVCVKEVIDLEREINQLKTKKNINFVCFNEHPDFNPNNYDVIKKLISDYLDSILPNKSSYEK
jgi:hypothetical protein